MRETSITRQKATALSKKFGFSCNKNTTSITLNDAMFENRSGEWYLITNADTDPDIYLKN